MTKWLVFVGTALVALAGCATPMMSAPRAPLVDHSVVQFISEMPAGAEAIMEIKASYNPRTDGPDSADKALDEMRRQAASVGANVIVLTDQRPILVLDRVPVGTSAYRTTRSVVNILTGTAVWDASHDQSAPVAEATP